LADFAQKLNGLFTRSLQTRKTSIYENLNPSSPDIVAAVNQRRPGGFIQRLPTGARVGCCLPKQDRKIPV